MDIMRFGCQRKGRSCLVKQIVRDPLFLQQKSSPATKDDAQVIVDLMDTLKANSDRCVGMAANMIGVKKQIIVVAVGPFIIPMVNPVITPYGTTYEESEILKWLEKNNNDFTTKKPLNKEMLVTNFILKAKMREYNESLN